MFHLVVLAALLRLAGLAPAPMRFDVFAADPVEATPEAIGTRAPFTTAPTPSVLAMRPARPAGSAVRPVAPARMIVRDTSEQAAAVRVPSAEPMESASTTAAAERSEVATAPASPAAEPSGRSEVEMASEPAAGGALAAEAEGSRTEEVATVIERSQAPPAPVTPLQPVTPIPFTTMTRDASAARAVVVADAPKATTPGSALGLGLARLRIRLDGARSRTTDQETDVISGTVIGGAPTRLVVQVDDRTSDPTLDGRAFTASVKLLPGPNRVRVLATDAQGADVEEVVTVDYLPPVTTDVALVSPRDGDRLSSDDPPIVEVQGQVSDPNLTAVWIVSNDRRMLVPVSAGRFRQVVPVVESEMRIRAETGLDRRGSAPVTVHGAAAVPAIGLFLNDWPRLAAGPAQMTVTWRPNPSRLESGARALPLRGIGTDTGQAGADFFYLRDARPGVYTFSVTYQGGAAAAVRPVLYLAGAPRSLQPVTLDGSGRAVIARLLLPQGVLWEQDDWFTGRSASGDTVTKFRFPDGVSWSERLGDVR